jgi:hypothetical protein
MRRAYEKYDLPFGPVADVTGVLINDGDESELEAEPQQLRDDPKKEIGLKTHFPHD